MKFSLYILTIQSTFFFNVPTKHILFAKWKQTNKCLHFLTKNIFVHYEFKIDNLHMKPFICIVKSKNWCQNRFESYLDLIRNVKTRVAVTKCEFLATCYPIESGHYKKIPRVERLCPLCNRYISCPCAIKTS